MGTLQILPWCGIPRTYRLGELTLLRVITDEPIEGLPQASERIIRRFIASYRALDGTVVDPCAIVAFRSDDPIRELTEAELNEAAESVQLAAFSSLAARRFFREPYSNSTCFTRVVQQFDDGPGIAVYSRRRDGGMLDGRILPATRFGIPPQAASVRGIEIDDTLFRALTNYRDAAKPSDWVRWQNAIDCFNFANTDDSSIPLHVEWVMTAAAFQRLTDSASGAEAVASAFESALQPEKPIAARDANVRQFNPKVSARSLRSVWAWEFYSLRGEYAHGKLTTKREHSWEPYEHLFLAAVAFPLLVKTLLENAGLYQRTDDDWAQIDAFETLLDSDFFTPPADSRHSWDTVWARLQTQHHGRRQVRKIVNELFEKMGREDAAD
ncbi:MAG TPA: hypothetical protein VJZ00_16675 [Thermoanaerobaculia bacterium]|nr:hypothetical protein [Thermoanaerobaculia bacterium]